MKNSAHEPSAANLPTSGERFLPGSMNGAIQLEHLHRYFLACRLAEGKSVLDIASGEGYGSNLLAQTAANVIGVDISEQAIAHAKAYYQRVNLEFRCGSCTSIPVADETIDLLVSFETLEHHEQHDEMILECRRVLKPDGILIISTPDKYEYSDKPKSKNPFHSKELYLSEFSDLLHKHFPNVAMHGQRIFHGSMIMALDGSSEKFLTITGGTDTFKFSEGILSPVYFVALASFQPLPSLQTTAYDDTEQFVAIHERALAENTQLKNENTQLKNEIARVKSTVSWQITKPLRLLANMSRLVRLYIQQRKH